MPTSPKKPVWSEFSATSYFPPCHSNEMGNVEIEVFRTHLAEKGQVVGSSTQNQALSALLFLCCEMLNLGVAAINAMRANRSQYVPTVSTNQEAFAVIHRCNV